MQQKVRSRRLARSFAADDVLKVEYVSEDDAWNSFKEEYFGDNPELADGFKDDNPLAGSDNYEVYMKDVESQKEVVKFAEGLDGVRKVNKSDVVARHCRVSITDPLCVCGDHLDSADCNSIFDQ